MIICSGVKFANYPANGKQGPAAALTNKKLNKEEHRKKLKTCPPALNYSLDFPMHCHPFHLVTQSFNPAKNLLT
jgi:hypothetical protein